MIYNTADILYHVADRSLNLVKLLLRAETSVEKMLSVGIFLQMYESLIYKAFSLLCSRKFFLERKLNGQLAIVLFFFAVKILAHVDVTDHSDF